MIRSVGEVNVIQSAFSSTWLENEKRVGCRTTVTRPAAGCLEKHLSNELSLNSVGVGSYSSLSAANKCSAVSYFHLLGGEAYADSLHEKCRRC